MQLSTYVLSHNRDGDSRSRVHKRPYVSYVHIYGVYEARLFRIENSYLLQFHVNA